MELINNQDRLLGDDLKKSIQRGSKVRIAATCFSIYAFDVLKEELKNVEDLKFIFSSPAFIEDKVADQIRKEKREFYIPKEAREDCLYGTQLEVQLRNKLIQKAVAKECAEWIRKKGSFKSNITSATMPNFISVQNGKSNDIYMPINGFTTTDLGYEHENALFQSIMKIDEVSYTQTIMNEFNRLWEDEQKVEHVTEQIVEYIATAYQENSPEYIYFVILYNIFSEFLEDLSENYMPNELTGFTKSIIWNKLYNFQKDGVRGIINKLEKYNGCILADSVGLGKTFSALAVMQYYSRKNRSILVLCPKKLASNWNSYRGNTKTNLFYKDAIRFDVLHHTDLSRKSGKSNGINLAEIHWEGYDLIVIDESHNFRNNFAFKNKETRYQFLLNKMIKPGVKTKVLMLSATPVNNKFKDLKNQIALAYGDDLEGFEEKLDTEMPIQKIFTKAQAAFNGWIKKPDEERTAKSLFDSLDLDFSILLDSVTIARSRKHIQKYYDTKDIGDFPKRRKPVSYYCDLTSRDDVIKYDDIYQKMMQMTMAIYAPSNYILESKAVKYSAIYDTKVEGKGTLKQSSREKSLQKLMSTMMLKRLESSVESFRLTLENLLSSNQEMLTKIDLQRRGGKIYVEKNMNEFSEVEDDFESGTRSTTTGKIKIDLADMNLLGWERHIKEDVAILNQLIKEMRKIQVEEDAKLQQLRETIDEKIQNPFNSGNKKVLIFSAFADTATYLYNQLAPYIKDKYGSEVAKVEGGTGGNKCTIPGVTQMDHILTLFSPCSKDQEILYPEATKTIDILIATDCISEGQNLQDCDLCINYDIHWNPVRIVQRFGRIDRIGSKNQTIQLINFWPNISLDEYINLNKRVASRMIIVDGTATADDNPIAEEQVDLDYRKKQLKKLQEGELQDLEDVEGSINITDLGLNEFRMDVAGYIKSHGEPKRAPRGMHAVIAEDLAKGVEKGVIYVLENKNPDIDTYRQNRLHPYYIIYIKEDGEVLYTHLEVKAVLDLLRASCKNQGEPIQEVCRRFNRETKDGYKMNRYSQLLESAIESIVKAKEDTDLLSLFQSGSNVLFGEKIKGIEDFELIAFVVIK